MAHMVFDSSLSLLLKYSNQETSESKAEGHSQTSRALSRADAHLAQVLAKSNWPPHVHSMIGWASEAAVTAPINQRKWTPLIGPIHYITKGDSIGFPTIALTVVQNSSSTLENPSSSLITIRGQFLRKPPYYFSFDRIKLVSGFILRSIAIAPNKGDSQIFMLSTVALDGGWQITSDGKKINILGRLICEGGYNRSNPNAISLTKIPHLLPQGQKKVWEKNHVQDLFLIVSQLLPLVPQLLKTPTLKD